VAARKKGADASGPTLYDLQGTKREKLEQIYARWHGCTRCPLHHERIDANGNPFSEIVFGEGNPDALCMIVGEAPGADEEATGTPFVGQSGMLLNQILASVSDDPEIQELRRWYYKSPRRATAKAENQLRFHTQVNEWRHREFFFANALACRPPENRAPTNSELKVCWERLYNMIYVIDPVLIIAVGKTALNALVRKQMEITKVRGQQIDFTIPGAAIPAVRYALMPVLHPSYLLRRADWGTKGGAYEKTLNDFRVAMHAVDLYRFHHFGTPIPERMGNV
jgi:uracil-DNA glycosylase family 4